MDATAHLARSAFAGRQVTPGDQTGKARWDPVGMYPLYMRGCLDLSLRRCPKTREIVQFLACLRSIQTPLSLYTFTRLSLEPQPSSTHTEH